MTFFDVKYFSLLYEKEDKKIQVSIGNEGRQYSKKETRAQKYKKIKVKQ